MPLEIGTLLKHIRREENLSQRNFADRAQISFRHLQRIESGDADITAQKLQNILRHFNYQLSISRHAPDWEFLTAAGLPITDRTSKHCPKISRVRLLRELCRALSDLRNSSSRDQRLVDSLKGFVLTLKTHYPSLFEEIARRENLSWLHLDEINGRHIKLRNISLGIFSNAIRSRK